MKLSEYLNIKRIEKLQVDLDGNLIDIYVKPLSAGAKNELLKQSKGFKDISIRAKKAKDDGIEFVPTDDDLLATLNYNQRQTFYHWCNEDGKSEFESFEDMLEKTPSELLDAVSLAIGQHNKPIEEENEPEKN